MMFELRVLSGLHLGAALPLFGDCWVIGQADDADLMLSDDGIDPQHCRLRLEGEQWRLEQASGDIRALAPGETFTVGAAWLCVAQADAPWRPFTPPVEPTAPPQTETAPAPPVRQRLFSRGMRTLMMSLMLLLTLTVVSWILQPTVAQTQVMPSGKRLLETAGAITTPLLKMLRERDLASAVKVSSNAKGVVLNGRLTDEQMQIFSRMMSRFNEQFRTGIPVNNNVEALKLTLPFRIVQITTGSRANIVTDDGQRLFIGDEIDDLRLVAITSNRIEFNGRDNIKVSW